MCNLNSPFFQDEDKARTYLEAQRWPNGAVCPHCGGDERIYPVKPQQQKGTSIRKGIYQCNDCDKQFTVTVGTVFERSKVPLHKWLLATYLICSSKKGISTKQIERSLGVTYKTAWFMMHRIREAMREKETGKLGGGGRFVEVDETYLVKKTKRYDKKRTIYDNEKVITLVERDGAARSFHVKRVTSGTAKRILNEQVFKDTAIITDQSSIYPRATKDYAGHATVNHSIHEYARGAIHTNTIEGYFSILKRGLTGIYQHWSSQHLKRYLSEYDFRYTYREKNGFNDMQRTNIALKGIEGKRITYGGHYAR